MTDPHFTGPVCTCQASRYDGDDGWDRDCPFHGSEAADVDARNSDL